MGVEGCHKFGNVASGKFGAIVLAISPDAFLKPQRPKRQIHFFSLKQREKKLQCAWIQESGEGFVAALHSSD